LAELPATIDVFFLTGGSSAGSGNLRCRLRRLGMLIKIPVRLQRRVAGLPFVVVQPCDQTLRQGADPNLADLDCFPVEWEMPIFRTQDGIVWVFNTKMMMYS
jgi:hypothetical protein